MLRIRRGLGGRSMNNLVMEYRAQGLSAAEGSNRDAAALAAEGLHVPYELTISE